MLYLLSTPDCPPDLFTITIAQFLTTASTTTFNMLGERGSPCVTPQNPWNSFPQYPPARATIHNQSQYVRRMQRNRGPMPYPYRIYGHMSLSKKSYALCRSRNITYKTSSLMAANC